jgi:hypothetical protein
MYVVHIPNVKFLVFFMKFQLYVGKRITFCSSHCPHFKGFFVNAFIRIIISRSTLDVTFDMHTFQRVFERQKNLLKIHIF